MLPILHKHGMPNQSTYGENQTTSSTNQICWEKQTKEQQISLSLFIQHENYPLY